MLEIATNSNQNIKWQEIVTVLINKDSSEALKLCRVLAGKDFEPVRPSKINVQQTAQQFVQNGKIKECTAFLISALKEDKPEDANLQTKLFELNINFDPSNVEYLFELNLFNNFDKDLIAKLCEQKGIFNRALQ